MRGHQEYLEAPYVNQALMEEAFEKWCAANDRDEDDKAWQDFEEFLLDQYDE